MGRRFLTDDRPYYEKIKTFYGEYDSNSEEFVRFLFWTCC